MSAPLPSSSSPPSLTITLNQQFGTLREVLQRAPRAEGWVIICQALTLAWLTDPAACAEVWIPYAQAALSRWPDTLRVVPPWWIDRVLAREHVLPMALARALVLDEPPGPALTRELCRHPEHHAHLSLLLHLPAALPDDARAPHPLDAQIEAGDEAPYQLKNQALMLWRTLQQRAPLAHPLILPDAPIETIEHLRPRGHLHPEDWPATCQALAIAEATGRLDPATLDAVAGQLERHVPLVDRPVPTPWVRAMRDGLPAPRALALCGTLTIDHLPPDEAERLALTLHAARPPIERLSVPLHITTNTTPRAETSEPADNLALALALHDLGADWLPALAELELRADLISGTPHDPQVARRLEHITALLDALDRPLDTLGFATLDPSRLMLLDYSLLELCLPRRNAHRIPHIQLTGCILEARELYQPHHQRARLFSTARDEPPIALHHQGATIEDWVPCDDPSDRFHYNTGWLHNVRVPASDEAFRRSIGLERLKSSLHYTFGALTITLDGPCIVTSGEWDFGTPPIDEEIYQTGGMFFFNGAEALLDFYESWE